MRIYQGQQFFDTELPDDVHELRLLLLHALEFHLVITLVISAILRLTVGMPFVYCGTHRARRHR